MAQGITARAIQVNDRPRSRRQVRMPEHTWHLRTEAWQIQPFLIAPVIPGETMRNITLQGRAVTDPLKNPLIGWWKEYYLFYVKLTDLDDRDDLKSLMLDFDHVMTSTALHQNADDIPNYFYGDVTFTGLNWVEQCQKRVVEEYFRNEGEAWDTYTINSVPAASIAKQNWLDSVTADSGITAEDIDMTDVGSPGGTAVTTQEVEESMRQWYMQSTAGLTNMSYEDWLRSFGVSAPQAEPSYRPELIRYLKEWTYPTNTVDPTDGDPSSACVWSISERADKDRYFSEPGFIFGVTVARPKVYLSNQEGAAVRYLENAYGFLPAILSHDTRTSLLEQASGQTPLSVASGAYWVDVRDLYLYGDQFVNFALTATDAGMVALPSAALQKRYAADADADAMFVGTAGVDTFIEEDGVARIMVATHNAEDFTPAS